MQVLYLGRATRTKETLPDFREKCRVARHSRVFRGLTGSQRTPGFGSSHPVIDTILVGSLSPRSQGQPLVGVLVAGANCSFTPSNIRPIDGVITLTESHIRKLSMAHDDALVLTFEVGKHLIKHILVDPSSSTDLLYLPALLCLSYKLDNLHNPGRVSIGFNGSQTSSLGEVVLPISIGPVTALVLLTVIDEPSSFNALLG